MTLDEAIKHAEEVADTCEFEASKYDLSDSYESYIASQEGECANEHRHLAEWLKDYKRLKESAVPLDKIKQLRKQIDEMSKYTSSIGGNTHYMQLNREEVLEMLDRLIEGSKD